jgi:hypothetical protein
MSPILIMTGAEPDEIWPLIRDHHYLRRMPYGARYCFAWRTPGGLFGDTGAPVAAAVFGIPVNRNWPQDALELSRLVRHPNLTLPLSCFLSWALRWLTANAIHPFVISYADSGQGHHGGIYQATGWTYIGSTRRDNIGFKDETGSIVQARACNHIFGTRSKKRIAELRPAWVPVSGEARHRYVRPLRQHLRTILHRHAWQALPYPKPDFAARPLDEPSPEGASKMQPLGAAP